MYRFSEFLSELIACAFSLLCVLSSILSFPAPASASAQFDSFANLSYVPGSSDPEQTLDLFVPSSKTPGEMHLYPLIVWVHGGGWSAGDKGGAPWLERFIDNRFAVASLNYRLVRDGSPNPGQFPAQIYDVKAAIRFLRANANKYHLDSTHFGAMGGSAGGHLVALLGASNGRQQLEGNLGNNSQSSYVEAVCDACGPANFFSLNQPGQDSAKEILLHVGPARYPKAASSRMLGATPDKRPDIALLASPVMVISEKTPPFLIVHGANDQTVPVRQAWELDQMLKAKHIQSTLLVVRGADHNVLAADAVVWPKVLSFFQVHLKSKP